MKNLLRIPVLAAAVASLMFAPGARAQGCILCYTSLAGGSAATIHAFQLGMLVLLVPALTLFAGVFLFIWYRARAATVAA